MSSFKRKVTSTRPTLDGTQPSASSSSILLTSSGIPSLDDILGGGIQLGTSLTVLNPDPNSAYADLLLKLYISQGLSSGQHVVVVGSGVRDFLDSCMWMPGSGQLAPSHEQDDAEHEASSEAPKIAWRYERMQKFKTTVSEGGTQEDYCLPFDLSCRVPAPVVDAALASGKLTLHELDDQQDPNHHAHDTALSLVTRIAKASEGHHAVRIAIPSLYGPAWGDVTPERVLQFLCRSRSLLRWATTTCMFVTLPPHLCSEAWGGPGWSEKLGWMSDACLSLNAFLDPTTNGFSPLHHGLLQIHKLPRVHTLVPASDRFSTLRGLSATSITTSASSATSENNIAFKCTRKRFIFETFHLDVEGGVGERRTTPAPSAMAAATEKLKESVRPDNSVEPTVPVTSVHSASSVQVVVQPTSEATSSKSRKPKKVGFQMDRPDLYEF